MIKRNSVCLEVSNDRTRHEQEKEITVFVELIKHYNGICKFQNGPLFLVYLSQVEIHISEDKFTNDYGSLCFNGDN